MIFRSLLIAVPLVLIALAAEAQRLPAVEADHYARCMDEARQKPAAAFDNANAWRIAGGGHPAEPCADVALIGIGRFADAGTLLEALADAMCKWLAGLRAEVM